MKQSKLKQLSIAPITHRLNILTTITQSMHMMLQCSVLPVSATTLQSVAAHAATDCNKAASRRPDTLACKNLGSSLSGPQTPHEPRARDSGL